jgi:hypothetical protein
MLVSSKSREARIMPATTAAARRSAEARIKALCCLGLPAESIMPGLLREVHAIIPSYGRTFFWADERGALSNIYDDNPDTAKIGALYIQEFYNRRECELSKSFTRSMREDAGVLTRAMTLSVERPAFLRSDFYNLLHRPLGYDDYLRLTVREGGRALGALMVWRAPGDPPFSAEDARRLARLEPFIAHAVAEPPARDVPLVESGDSGLVLANRDGKPLHLSPEARRLLFLASHEAIAPGEPMRQSPLLPPPVVRICRGLSDVLAGKADPVAPLAAPQRVGRLRVPRLSARGSGGGERPDRHHHHAGRAASAAVDGPG